MILSELIVAHSVHQTWLANTWVSDNDELEQEVLLQRAWPTSLHRNDLVFEWFYWCLLNLLNLLGLLWWEHSIRVSFRRHFAWNKFSISNFIKRSVNWHGVLGFWGFGVSWFAKSTRFRYARTTAVHWRSTAVAWLTNGHSYYFWSEIVVDLSFCFALLMILDCDSFVRLFFVWSTRRLSFLSRILNIITT